MTRFPQRWMIVAIGTLACSQSALGQRILYVDSDAVGLDNGASWTDAYTDLQAGLDAAISIYPEPVEVRVAAGTYRPSKRKDPADPRTATFRLQGGVALSGGFAGGVGGNARDFLAYETILSGDLNGDDGPDFANNEDNAYHVVTGGASPWFPLDGFTITGGNANGPTDDDRFGGGIYGGASSLRNCTIRDNSSSTFGGGLYVSCTGTCGVHRIENCRIVRNRSNLGGGLFYTASSDTVFANCTFANNAASWGGGASTYYLATCTFINCVFFGNTSRDGGAVFNWMLSHPRFINCTFANNFGTGLGGGIFSYRYTNPTLTNCILWGNGGDTEAAQYSGDPPYLNYSCVQGLTGSLGGVGNRGDDPGFFDPIGRDGKPGTLDDDFRLSPGSPCIDGGDNRALSLDIHVDRDGTPRLLDDPASELRGVGAGAIADMGAFEYRPPGLDIRPGKCPNLILTDRGGFVPAAILGSRTFQVSRVNLASLELRRSDGSNVGVFPADIQGRRATGLMDVGAPAVGNLCVCDMTTLDGIEDRIVQFAIHDLVREMNIGTLPDGTVVDYALHGELINGTPFEVHDCAVVQTGLRPGNPP